MRWLAALLAAIATLVGVACAAFVLLITTTPGARLALAVAESAVPELDVGGLDGTIVNGLELRQVRFASAGVEVRLQTLHVVPAFARLAEGVLEIESIAVNGGTVRVIPSESSAPPQQPLEAPAVPSIPEAVTIRSIAVTDVTVEGVGENAIELQTLAARLDGPALQVDTLALEAYGVALSATAAATIGPDLRGSFAVTANRGVDDAAETVDATGQFALLTTSAPWRVELGWDRLGVQRPGLALASAGGSVTVVAGAAPMQVDLDARLEGAPLPDAAQIRARAAVDGATVELTDATVSTLGGTIEMFGAAAVDALSGHLTLTAEGLDPQRLEPRLAGRLGGRLVVAVASGATLRASASGDTAGELLGRPLEGRLAVSLVDDGVAVQSAVMTLEDSKVEVAGLWSPERADLRFDADAPAIENWYPPVHGSVTASGRVSGNGQDPSVDVRVAAADLAYEGVAAAPLERVVLEVQGSLQAHDVTLDARHPLGMLELQSRQGWSGGALRGELRAASVEAERIGAWALTAPAEFTARGADLTLERMCYAGPAAASLCLGVASSSAELQGRNVPAALAEPWLAQPIQLIGTLDVDGRLSYAGAPTGQLEVRQRSLRIAAPDMQDVELPELRDLVLASTLTEESLEGSLTARLGSTGDPITGQLRVAPPAADGELQAELDAALTDLALLDALVGGVENLAGTVTARVSASGTAASPQLTGVARAEGLSADVPPLGIAVEDGSLTARMTGSDGLAIEGRLCSMGCIGVDGTLELDPNDSGAWRLSAAIDGRQFQLAALPDLKAVIGPELQIEAREDRWELTGTLGFRDALVRLDDVPRTAIRPAEETVVHGGAVEEQSRAALPLAMKVEARLGDARFEGLGIGAQLDGVLTIELPLDGDLAVSGTTTIEEGTFTAYGQTLVIERGQLIFQGDAANPALDLRATREVDDGIVGLLITGTAREPRSEIFSDPALSESEALARLLTGRSLETAESTDPQALERAALGLGIRRALPALDRIGTRLGLDELTVGSASGTEGALVAGKQLGEDVYLRYKHGLFEDFAGLELIYRITDRFQLHTETGTAQSIDLIYQVGRDATEALSESAADYFEDVAAPAGGADTPVEGPAP